MANLHVFAILNQTAADSGIPPNESRIQGLGISCNALRVGRTQRDARLDNMECYYAVFHSVRLDHAARLLQRRALLNTSQPIGEVACDSSFNDSTHFARKFRRRFGHPPGAHRRSD
jgi:AraC family transcriptional regulator, positive regulator of tynA and feaB